MHWKTKAAYFRVLGTIPFGSNLHFLAQRHITRTWPRSAEHIKALVGVARKTINEFQTLSSLPLQSCTFFEIGAGRDLAVPLALRMLGVANILTTDIIRLAKLDLVNTAARMVASELEMPASKFESWSKLEAFGIRYAAPFKAATEDLPQIDAFVSNEVLEHVPPPALKAVFANVCRRMKPGAVSLHNIDYSDHYARDGGVSRYNFLQFSDDEWRPFNASMHYVNRLRHSEYVAIMSGAGFNVVSEEKYGEELPPDLVLHPKFAAFEDADLKTMRSRISAIKR
ncbi:MAG TPA: class I SAM-dependent methyltransferase [Mesorhizobium sp.]|uniref:class I SAM-dependent methyltransferase n=1 Tax=Mesorhizobium sp. TaxID=1871066 RepID=UPI002DDC9CD9|nr:class I SAM-dependent methyltransferase [Mesorhizobium sp.]HEV2504450.1 class I SAM-dependent methyltransferase [Mesorhizobium sp.]